MGKIKRAMPRFGLSKRDRVYANESSNYHNYGMGFIIDFLEDSTCSNNGAALVLFHHHPQWGRIDFGIRAYIDTKFLTKI